MLHGSVVCASARAAALSVLPRNRGGARHLVELHACTAARCGTGALVLHALLTAQRGSHDATFYFLIFFSEWVSSAELF